MDTANNGALAKKRMRDVRTLQLRSAQTIQPYSDLIHPHDPAGKTNLTSDGLDLTSESHRAGWLYTRSRLGRSESKGLQPTH